MRERTMEKICYIRTIRWLAIRSVVYIAEGKFS
jgi:hypothetical protein